MAPTDLSPNADNLYIGGGELWFLPVGGTAPADWRDLGYVPELEFESSIERRPYYGRRGPIRQLVKNPVSSQAATVRLRCDEWTGPNIAMGFLGLQTGADETAKIDIGSVTQVEGALVLRNMTDIGPRWNMWFPSVSFAPNGVIAMLGDDYGGIPLVGEVSVVSNRFGIISRADITEANTSFWPTP